MQTILTIFGAAALTALAGLLGASIQSRREHARWLREKRYDAYLDLLHLLDATVEFRNSAGVEPEYVADARVTLSQAKARLASAADGSSPAHTNGIDETVARAEAVIEHAADLSKRIPLAVVPITLVGPDRVREASHALLETVGDPDREKAARTRLRREMQKVLKINT